MARLVEARIRGLRTLADVTLALGGLTVLIGDNGAGKSSILEALRIASLLVRSNFVDVLGQHMLASAIRKDASALELDLRVETEGHNLVYSLRLDPSARSITHESLHDLPPGLDLSSGASSTATPILVRTSDNKLETPDRSVNQKVSSSLTMFEYFGRASDHAAVGIVREACEGIDVHLPFRVSATWANRSTGQGSALRDPRIVEPGRRLELFGANLATVYQLLKNSGAERWRETMELLRLGIGPDFEDVSISVPGSGHISLELELRGVGSVSAFHLADGLLAYLSFVALVQLDDGRSLLAFDEPEHHLHPALLARVVDLLEDAAQRYPVVLSTHSDQLLDCLSDPVASVVVCELDRDRRTQLRRLDPEQFEKWRDDYRGVGSIRAEGELRSILR